MSSSVETLEKAQIESSKLQLHELVLYNDEVNTFDHVIETLILVCKHTSIQAEQCALLVHYKGKCTVKSGTFDDLKPKCLSLLDAGLSAKIEG